MTRSLVIKVSKQGLAHQSGPGVAVCAAVHTGGWKAGHFLLFWEQQEATS